MSEEQASEWGWEAMGSEEDGENENTTVVATDDSRAKDIDEHKSDSGRTLPSSVSLDKVQAPKFSDPKHVALSIGSQSLQKGITSSPSFQELERAIGATLAMSLNVADHDQHQNRGGGVGFDITQQKLHQQRIRQQQQHRQQQPQYPSAYSPRHGLGQYPPPHPLNNQQSSARNELGLFVNESESRAIILFHSPLVSPIAVRDACQKCGVLYYIRPEFHGKGVTLLSYFDLRSAIHAHGSVVEELGPGAEASAHYSVMLHAANNNSEEFRLVARNLPEGHPEAEVQSIFSRYGQLRSIQRIFGTSEDDENKALDPDSESSSATSTEDSAFKVEYFNIQDARLAASELCATSAQLLGPDAVVSFAPLDSRKQQLCRQLLATLSRWRSELSSSPSSLSSHGNMNIRGAGGMGVGLGMYSTTSGSSSYQMPMMAAHQQQQAFQGMYGNSGNIGVGGVLMDPSLSMGGQQQYSMGMGMQMGIGIVPYGVPVQVPYGHTLQQQQPQQLQQQQQRHFDFKDTHSNSVGNDKYRIRADSPAQSSDGSSGNTSNSASKERDNNHQQAIRGFDMQGQGQRGNEAWGSNSRGHQTQGQGQSYGEKGQGQQHGDETSSVDYSQHRNPYASYGTNPNQQSQSQHMYMQQQQQNNGYRNKAITHNMAHQQYAYQPQPVGGATDFYGQSHRPHHHNGGHGQHAISGYPQGGQGQMQGRRGGKGPGGSQPFSPGASGSQGGMSGGMNSNNGAAGGSGGGGGGDYAQADFSLDIGRVNEGEDVRTTVMVRNIPNKYQQQMLLEEINISHEGTYDFFYLPIDFKNKCNVGYCFINFLDPKHIVAFVKEFNGLRWKSFNSEKVCAITFARIQGKGSMVSRFQNSSLLEKDDEYRPLLFYSSGPDRGKPEPFPSSSRSVPVTSQSGPQQQQSPGGGGGGVKFSGSYNVHGQGQAQAQGQGQALQQSSSSTAAAGGADDSPPGVAGREAEGEEENTTEEEEEPSVASPSHVNTEERERDREAHVPHTSSDTSKGQGQGLQTAISDEA